MKRTTHLQRRKAERRTESIITRVTKAERKLFESRIRPDETFSEAARRLLLRPVGAAP